MFFSRKQISRYQKAWQDHGLTANRENILSQIGGLSPRSVSSGFKFCFVVLDPPLFFNLVHHCILYFKYCRSLERHVTMSSECAWFWIHKLINIWPLSLHWSGHYQKWSMVHKTPCPAQGRAAICCVATWLPVWKRVLRDPPKPTRITVKLLIYLYFQYPPRPPEWFIVCEVLNKH